MASPLSRCPVYLAQTPPLPLHLTVLLRASLDDGCSSGSRLARLQETQQDELVWHQRGRRLDCPFVIADGSDLAPKPATPTPTPRCRDQAGRPSPGVAARRRRSAQVERGSSAAGRAAARLGRGVLRAGVGPVRAGQPCRAWGMLVAALTGPARPAGGVPVGEGAARPASRRRRRSDLAHAKHGLRDETDSVAASSSKS
jgi:hypothetical protein